MRQDLAQRQANHLTARELRDISIALFPPDIVESKIPSKPKSVRLPPQLRNPSLAWLFRGGTSRVFFNSCAFEPTSASLCRYWPALTMENRFLVKEVWVPAQSVKEKRVTKGSITDNSSFQKNHLD
jgi:hypothetical protein